MLHRGAWVGGGAPLGPGRNIKRSNFHVQYIVQWHLKGYYNLRFLARNQEIVFSGFVSGSQATKYIMMGQVQHFGDRIASLEI